MFCTGNRRKLHICTTEIRRKRKMDIVKMNHQNDYFHRVRSSFLEISTTDCKISKPEVLLSRKGFKFAGLGGGHKHRKQNMEGIHLWYGLGRTWDSSPYISQVAVCPCYSLQYQDQKALLTSALHSFLSPPLPGLYLFSLTAGPGLHLLHLPYPLTGVWKGRRENQGGSFGKWWGLSATWQ